MPTMQFSVPLDTAQQYAAARLQHICTCLNNNHPPAQGIYLYGPVGRGKSMLMDAFFHAVQIKDKQRLHFHHFMKMVHQALNTSSGRADPLRYIAADWASRTRLLCLDEFMVEDIGDAMLLGTLWRYLFELDVVLVTTSNVAMDDLYKNGLQRERFLPAIELLNIHCEAVWLDGGQDYRRQHLGTMPYFQVSHHSEESNPSDNSNPWLRHTVEAISGPLSGPGTTEVLGRQLSYLGANPQSILFEFNALCSGPRSQRDYMELASRYALIAVADVPRFSFQATDEVAQGIEEGYLRPPQHRPDSLLDNEARRFIALVDECYDQQCLLIISAAALPDELYQARQLASVFERCASRLYEMQRWPAPRLKPS